jgi:hypothetical protein
LNLLTTEEYERQCTTQHKQTILDTESKETVTYSSRTTITTEDRRMRYQNALRHPHPQTLNWGSRGKKRSYMSTKAGLEKMARDREKMADKRNRNICIKQKQKAKQKPSTKDIIGTYCTQQTYMG